MQLVKSKAIAILSLFFLTQILYAEPPDWEDCPGCFEFTATMNSVVRLDGVQLGDDGDILAGFADDGEVRGIALQLNVPFGPYAGTILYEMQIRSNAGGDNITFQYYDASEDAIYNISENYTFIINDIIGDVVTPHELTAVTGSGCDNEPDWVDWPGGYEFTATMTSIVLDGDGNQLGDEGDILAGFAENGEVRGIALQLNVPFGPYAGTILYEMQIRSNDEGDVITFKYFDASECEITDVAESYTFVINDIQGDVMTPYELNLGGLPPCEDDDSAVSPFTCAVAVTNWGCDFLWGGTPISEFCPVSCDTCPEADVYGCTDPEAENYNPDANI
ncbi:MAG: hypothetical protein QGF57_02945, partial [Candidatus Marinimicrobia bacterium]|nr:hypothetical protein [Candidatus Neomarinimicrobiota bacterium]